MKVLIVEDEALVALQIESAAEEAGHSVVGVADNIASAMEIAGQSKPDLALVDVMLARDESGLSLAVMLAEAGVPVFLASGNCPADSARSRALGCLHKPFRDEDLSALFLIAEAVINGQPAPTSRSAIQIY